MEVQISVRELLPQRNFAHNVFLKFKCIQVSNPGFLQQLSCSALLTAAKFAHTQDTGRFPLFVVTLTAYVHF